MTTFQAPALSQDNNQLTTNVRTILNARYLKKDDKGQIIETPDEMFWRVANAVAEAETTKTDKKKWAKLFHDEMASNKFLPNSPTLMNAGIEGTLSACFVIGVEDTMESILYAVRKAGMVMKFGGGVGYSLSKIRSKGRSISSTHGKACGPVAVLHQLNQTSKLITQGGKRNGANMAILSIDHPDIREFIHCKDGNIGASEHNQVIDQFNISLAVPRAFFSALDTEGQWDLIDPHTKEITETVNARDLWDEIIQSAWSTGDPGMFFIDTVNELNTTPNLGRLESTNPCGEVPLYPEEACNLGSLNLTRFIKHTGNSNGQHSKEIDYSALGESVRIATRFLDNVVTVNKFPIQEIRDTVDSTRKLGLGVMGWHDLLIELNIPYESDEAIKLAAKLSKFIQAHGHNTSEELADERGVFPAWTGSIFDKVQKRKMRNATVTCIAPTGTISRIAGASSGIEPIFAWITESKVMRGQIESSLIDIHPVFEELVNNHPNGNSIKAYALKHGTLQGCEYLSVEQQKLLLTANEILASFHIRHQAAWQEGVDLAVSKTINMTNSSTKEDVDAIYREAERLNCKGITIYRDGSRQFEVLNVVKEKEVKEQKIREIEVKVDSTFDTPVILPEKISLDWKAPAIRYKVPTPLGVDAFIFISKDDNDYPREVIIITGKAGSDILADAEALGRSITLGLKNNIPLEEYHNQLQGIQSGRFTLFKGKEIASLPDAIAYALRDYINNPEDLDTITNDVVNGNYNYCPHCANKLIPQESCLVCSNPQCGYSKC